ncbi:MAG: sortase [Chloroflexota bacterium]
MRRPVALLLAAVLLLIIGASPAEGITVKRIWRGGFGPSAANGVVAVTGYMDGSGQVSWALKGLRPRATYRAEVHKGTCANLGTVAARPSAVVTDAGGAATVTRALGWANINGIWSANWTGPISMRIYAGTSIKCANLGFIHATRVRVPAYGIDLPVVRTPSGYPYCNVAMYQDVLAQPTEPGVTFLFAHARKGMFLPLLLQWQANKGVKMIGKPIYVYTSNNMVHTYTIYQARLVNSIQNAVGITAEELWLQTSTGLHGTVAKLIVKAHRVADAPTTWAAAHPTPHIVHCGY